MSIKNTSTSYGSVAKFLHWLIFFLVIGMLSFGFFLEDLPKEWKPLVYNMHKLTGLSILVLMLFRGFWAFINVKPQLPINITAWQKFAVRFVHSSLYLLVIAMPLAGWVGSIAANRPPFLGSWKFELPIAENKAVSETAFEFHYYIALMLIAFISIHFLAAMYHHYIRKDNVLRRMLPGRR